MDQTPARKPAAGRNEPFRWCPVRSLSPRHRPRILAHLQSLGDADRYLRFGTIASDAQIAHYVERLDFERDELFGVFNRRLALVAMTHLAYIDDRSAEFGVSVQPRLRGRGIGARLFELASLHARNRGVDTLIVHALTENTPMLRIARSAGATLQREGGDATAVLKLPEDDFASQLAELIESRAGEVDYGFKQQAKRLDALARTLRGLVPDGVNVADQ